MTRRIGTDVDVVVVGSGAAGLAVARRLAATRSVAVVTAGVLGGGSTPLAQGGLAVAIDPADNPARHAGDTMTAGAGLCDEPSVARLVEEGPLRVAELLADGAALDRDGGGRLLLGREGGHSRRRVVHAGGDASGAELSRALVSAVRSTDVQVVEQATVTDILFAAGRSRPAAAGVRMLVDGRYADLTARAVVLATGGVGGLFAASTNPSDVTGEGLGLALRAGATLTDVEFVQFHPTALRNGGSGHRLPLVTEALRGEGAVLVDGDGRLLMAGHHPLGDLAPRDVVARRLHEVGTDGAEAYLDATRLGAQRLREQFPTVHASCLRIGVDPATQPIPVTPAQHFLCGGVVTDRWGETGIPGLFAAGEVAATGVHGANRLASNSLVEGLVVGGRVAARLTLDLPEPRLCGHVEPAATPALPGDATRHVAAIVAAAAGIVRTEAGLAAADDSLAAMTRSGDTVAMADPAAGNRWLAALALVRAARHRTESRGCHWREDFPETAASWSRHVFIRLDAGGRPGVDESWQVRRSA
ncbi:MAG TPA: L-aspartate oxidase [Mycobacteriales bacterium]|nr:L-aspartate oxidase [Mycobacteriales bacterium]